MSQLWCVYTKKTLDEVKDLVGGLKVRQLGETLVIYCGALKEDAEQLMSQIPDSNVGEVLKLDDCFPNSSSNGVTYY